MQAEWLPCLTAAAATAIVLLLLFWIYYRYQKEKILRLTNQLEDFLNGTPVPAEAFTEGMLPVLEMQLQKVLSHIREQNEQLTDEKQFLARSLADISHQLRTPLTSMELAVSMLNRPDVGEEERGEIALQLRQQLSQISWLIESLLKLSKLDAGAIVFQQETVQMKQLIKECVSPMMIAFDIRDLTLSVDGAEHASIHCDFFWTREAVTNLLKNCMEHTPEGGSVSISWTDNPIYTELIICDSGSGFSREELPFVFERFYRGNGQSGSGYGIGLALTRSIIKAQNGTIKADNRPAGGARFTIRFYK